MPGAYLITGPEFDGRVPGDMTEVRLRTKIGFAAVRIAVSGSADLTNAVGAQEGFRMMPLRNYLEQGLRYDTVDFSSVPFPELTAPQELESVRPDRRGDEVHAARLARRGRHVRAGARRDRSERGQGLRLAGARRAHPGGAVTRRPRGRADHQRALDVDRRDRQWLAGVDGNWPVQLRLGAQRRETKNQVGTELAEQVVYLNCRVDADGEPLDGGHRYTLDFAPGQTPPVAGMWNLAMYDDDMFFIPNEIDRFTIGSTTDGVPPNPDGSLTIYIQHDQPDQERAANWLPAPTGSFNLTMRYYTPLAPILDGTYKLPTDEQALASEPLPA